MNLPEVGALASLARLSEKLISFIIILIASRMFGSESIGEFFFYFSLASLFIPLIDIGFDKLLLHSWYNKDKTFRKQYLSLLCFTKVILGLIAFFFICAIDYILHGAAAKPAVACACLAAIFFMEFGDLLRRPRYAEGKFFLDLTTPIALRLATLCGLLYWAQDMSSASQIAYVYAVANGIGFALSYLMSKPYYPNDFSTVTIDKIRTAVKSGLPFSLTHLCVMFSLFFDSVVLGMYSFDDVGQYNVAYKVLLVIATLSQGTCYILFAKIVKLHQSGEAHKAQELLSNALSIHLIIFGTMSIGAWHVGPQLIGFLFGSDFTPAGFVFCQLSMIIVLISFTNLIGQCLEAIEHQKQVMVVNIYAMLFNIIANIIFIPLYGMYAAALSTLITEIIILGAQYHLLKKTSLRITPNKRFLPGIIFCILILIAYSQINQLGQATANFFNSPDLSLFIVIAYGIIIALALVLCAPKFWFHNLLNRNSTCAY